MSDSQNATAAWIQLRFQIDKTNVEALEDALLAAGALAVILEDQKDQPILEPGVGETPLWQDLHVAGLFEAGIDTQALLEEIYTQWPACKEIPHQLEIIEDKDWEREWMQDYEPMRFGERLWVCPSWKPQPDPNATNLMLDPGLAFGTGTHPTTALCLEWLDGTSLDGKTVIDYGCGSGILGIAALLLGAKKVYAVDLDPQALDATLENARRNDIDLSRLTILHPRDADSIPPTADVLVANILAGPLQELAPRIANLIKKDGLLALSGLLDNQVPELTDCYNQWFTLNEPAYRKEWVLMSGKKRV